jgi:2-polyprenyl-3-methyl-5-hydroxy-6-metoxy-1,4-benzoquinol methylase
LGADPAPPPRPWPAALAARGDLVETLNRSWQVAGAPPAPAASLGQRLAYPVRRLLARLLRPQETFNSTVVQYINQWPQSMADALTSTLERCEAVADAALRAREAVAARERRVEAGIEAIRASHDELRTAVGVLQQATQTLRHELARLRDATPDGQDPVRGRPRADSGAPPFAAAAGQAMGDKYVGFEDQFRGSPAAIRERLSEYVPLFAGASDVLDVGCGRGEFLDLLREHGITARGIDTNAAMVQVTRDKGLAADEADAVTFLRTRPPGSLGGLFAAQVVEHLEPPYLMSLLDAAFDALRPGAPIVLETINPACWFAFFESYIRDITHVRPLHPETLKYLLVATGFQRVDVHFRVPYPEHEKLQPLPVNAALGDAVDTLNGNLEKLNRLLFTHLDYAATAVRP